MNFKFADLGLIDSKLGLYVNVNVNNGQNKFEVHISKNVAKMAILWPKIGQRHFGARASHGHNLAIFHQIFTNEHTKMTSSLRQIEWNKILSSISLFYILVFWPHFCSEAAHGQCCTYGLKTTLKLFGTCSGHHGQLISQNCVLTKIRAEPPPPPPTPLRKIKSLCLSTVYLFLFLFTIQSYQFQLVSHGHADPHCDIVWMESACNSGTSQFAPKVAPPADWIILVDIEVGGLPREEAPLLSVKKCTERGYFS